MLTFEEALEVVGRAAGPPRAVVEAVPLARALGRVLAEDVRLDRDLPPFTRSAMDGFALRAADAAAGRPLRIVGRTTAGESPFATLGEGEAVAIMTGAPLPDGADAVVPVERAERSEATLVVREAPRPGDHVSARGEAAARGSVVLRAGARVDPGAVGVLAAAGRTEVPVARRPRVAILCTGDELVPVARDPGPHGIRDSNGFALAAQVERAGGEPDYGGPVGDEPQALRRAVERGLSADVLCVSGGVSVGEKDLVPRALEDAGVERLFHRWAVKPGGPLWFGRRGDVLVFGLPGNPVATFVGFETLVVPALRTRVGRAFSPRPTARVLFDGTFLRSIARRSFVPAALDLGGERPAARPIRSTGSGDLLSTAGAAALAVVPEGARIERPRETLVDAILLGDGA
jgi:molybdopterin molybdotransferase